MINHKFKITMDMRNRLNLIYTNEQIRFDLSKI